MERCNKGNVTFTRFTDAELAEELERLEKSLPVTVEQAELMALAEVLEPDQYRILQRIRELRWLQSA